MTETNNKQDGNRWKGFVLGVLGSIAGLMATRAYWQQAAPTVRENVDLGGKSAYTPQMRQDWDDIALVGDQREEGESSTAALGRILYQNMVGQEPESEETKELLSYLVHWGYGMLQGGLYGAVRAGGGNGPGLDLVGGTLYATGLWLLGDEVSVPMLGLQAGPTATAPTAHINRLGAHLTYGLATAATTQLLRKIL